MHRFLAWRWRAWALGLLLGGWACRVGAAELDREAGPEIVPSQVLPLFNGRNLDGFRTWLADAGPEDPRGVFTVTNGVIRLSGDGFGYLRTTRRYRNYRLVVEYRWGRRNYGERVGKARDSGIFLHAQGPDGNSDDGNGAFMAAIECNLFEGATGDFLLIRGHDAGRRPLIPRLTARVSPERDPDGWFTWDPAGDWRTLERWGRVNWRNKSPVWADRFGFRGAEDVERRVGRWNRVECHCAGDSVTVWVNGTRVNQAVGLGWTGGWILLQCEGSEIEFRKVELQPVSLPRADGR